MWHSRKPHIFQRPFSSLHIPYPRFNGSSKWRTTLNPTLTLILILTLYYKRGRGAYINENALLCVPLWYWSFVQVKMLHRLCEILILLSVDNWTFVASYVWTRKFAFYTQNRFLTRCNHRCVIVLIVRFPVRHER